MRNLKTFEYFKNQKWNESSDKKLRDINILDNNFPKLREIFDAYGLRITKCICVDNQLSIDVCGDRVERPDRELIGRVEKWVSSDNRVGTFRSNFQMGKKNEGSIHKLFITIQNGICDNVSSIYQKYIDWLDKYGINSFDEYLRILTITTRDCNKNAKSNGIDKSVKILCYQVKDWVIKYLFRNKYISDIKGHKIDGTMYYLFYTKVNHKDSMDGVISFHIPSHRSNKFEDYVDRVERYPLEERDYIQKTGSIDNRERMVDFLDMVNCNLFDDRSTTFIKGYLGN